MSLLVDEIGEPVARFRYPDAKTFKTMVDSLSKILDEASFKITRDGVSVVGMDPARVALIRVEIPYESFLELEVSEDRDSVEAGFNMDVLKDMLKRGKKGDVVEFRVADDKILVVVEGKVLKRYLVPNLEVVSEAPEEVKLEHDVEAVVLGDVLKKALRDAEVVGDVVEFEADEERLVIRGRGEGRARAETILTRETTALIDLQVKRPAKSLYDIQYLKNVVALTGIAEAVEVKFSSEKPLELVFRSPEGSRIMYLLAPSV